MTAYRKGDLGWRGDKGYFSYDLSPAHLALMPSALGLKAQSITYWMSLWDKCCKMRYGNRNGLSATKKDAQYQGETFFKFFFFTFPWCKAMALWNYANTLRVLI